MVLVTGVTGYIGSRLVPRLLEDGVRTRVLLRGAASRLDSRAWKNQVEIAQGDVLSPDTLISAMQGIDAAYFMVGPDIAVVGLEVQGVCGAEYLGAVAGIDALQVAVLLQFPVKAGCAGLRGQHAP